MRSCVFPFMKRSIKEEEIMNKSYIIKTETSKVKVKDIEIEFTEDIAIDPDTDEEIYVRELEIENDRRLYDQYKQLKGLLTSTELKAIRDEYQLNQKEFSRILGFGDITIHRFENGAIQTDANDAILRFVTQPDYMEKVLYKNREKIDDLLFQKLLKRLEELKLYNKHRIGF